MWVAVVLFCAGNNVLSNMSCESAVVDRIFYPTEEQCVADTMRKASGVNNQGGPVKVVVIPGSICMQVQ